MSNIRVYHLNIFFYPSNIRVCIYLFSFFSVNIYPFHSLLVNFNIKQAQFSVIITFVYLNIYQISLEYIDINNKDSKIIVHLMRIRRLLAGSE